MDISHFLALHLSQTKYLSSIHNAQIVEDPETGEPTLVFEQATVKKSVYKKALKEVLWGTIEQMYITYIATKMLREGYKILSLEGGWLVISPAGEEYQLQEKECTCPSKEYPCKHMILRDWMLEFRAWGNEYKQRKGLK